VAARVVSESISPLKVAGLYIGTVVGAGFASGQEVLQFFGRHGLGGLWGIGLATILFAAYGAMILILGHRLRATSHVEVVRASGIPWAGALVDAIVTFFLLGGFSAMAAGSGAVFAEQYGSNALWGSLAMVAISVATVLLGIRGVVSAISLVAPFLIGSVLLVSLVTLWNAPIQWAWEQPRAAALASWPISAVAYASYNLVFAIAVLGPAGVITSETNARRGAFLGAVGLGVCALAIDLALLTAVPQITRLEVPMLALADRALGPLSILYSVVLLAEVYSTAVASLYGLVARLTDPEGPWFKRLTLVAAAVGFAGSLLGFSELVGRVYSAVGLAGFILLVTVVVGYRRTQS